MCCSRERFLIFLPLQHGSDGTEFDTELVKELQIVFGFEKTRKSVYRPQGNSVLKRVHSTMHNMPAMYSKANFENLAGMLPFVQRAHNTAYDQTLEETPNDLMFGRRSLLPVDVILGEPSSDSSASMLESNTLAYELARHNLKERIDRRH